MSKETRLEIRDLRNGDWYWIHKAVIRNYIQKIGATGVIVYSVLASLADCQQTCYPSQKYIADKIGYSRATVNKAIRRLENSGLIRVERRSRYHCIYSLLRLSCQSSETQMSTGGNSDVKYVDTTNNKLTRNINKTNKDMKNNMNSKRSEGFKPETREELLALDLAEGLSDRKSLPLYLSYAKKYPESFLRRIMGEVREIPFEKIKKSRGALFSFIVKKYDQKNIQDHIA